MTRSEWCSSSAVPLSTPYIIMGALQLHANKARQFVCSFKALAESCCICAQWQRKISLLYFATLPLLQAVHVAYNALPFLKLLLEGCS